MGDGFVGAMLEALLQDPSLIDIQKFGYRAGLFKLFTQIYKSTSFRGSFSEADIDPSLEKISLAPRQAFLLLSVEGFSEQEIAFILDVAVSEIRSLVELAGYEMAIERQANILIIEDEAFLAMRLSAALEGAGHTIAGIARTYSEAIALAGSTKPGLIVADIQLADGSSGLDAVNEILKTSEIPTIFITAYPERLLAGNRPEPAFLLSKPVEVSMLIATVSQALFFQRKSRSRKKK
jgi:CheY-like chemotaxis protein